HGCFVPYDATFLVFSDYARNAVRMSALMGAHAIHVYTHDSIGLGEDGPTHQPVEHLAALRHIPHNDVWRPCDAVESAVCWKAAIERKDGPSCLVFSRQSLAHQPRTGDQVQAIARGGYVLKDSAGAPELILIATGSEVGLAMEAAEKLGDKVRVVSMPSTDVFDRQDAEYRDSVLPPTCRRRVAIEAGVPDFWRKYVGLDGAVVGLDRFGASAPAGDLFPRFGFTVEHVVEAARSLVERRSRRDRAGRAPSAAQRPDPVVEPGSVVPGRAAQRGARLQHRDGVPAHVARAVAEMLPEGPAEVGVAAEAEALRQRHHGTVFARCRQRRMNVQQPAGLHEAAHAAVRYIQSDQSRARQADRAADRLRCKAGAAVGADALVNLAADARDQQRIDLFARSGDPVGGRTQARAHQVAGGAHDIRRLRRLQAGQPPLEAGEMVAEQAARGVVQDPAMQAFAVRDHGFHQVARHHQRQALGRAGARVHRLREVQHRNAARGDLELLAAGEADVAAFAVELHQVVVEPVGADVARRAQEALGVETGVDQHQV